MKKITIIGAGASGVYLAYLLKLNNPLDEVIVLEANKDPLKKLLATGNGRCNLSNKDMDISHYKSDNNDLVKDIIDDFSLKEEFEKMGLYSKYLGDLLYPRSEQAKSVKNILLNKAISQGVIFIYNQKVTNIKYKDKYYIYTDNNTYKSDITIITCGSPAGKLSNSDSRENLLKSLKIDYKEMTPTLTQMYTSPVYKKLKGVKVKGTFTLTKDKKVLRKEKGELLFTDYGVSGIAIMQLSREYIKGCKLHIDMMDDYSFSEVKDIIHSLNKNNLDYDGLVPYQMIEYMDNPIKWLKDLTLDVVDLRDNNFAQVCNGGVCLSNLNNHLESKKYPGLYFGGEILNVSGDCGGYNLHFAFACSKRILRGIYKC